MQVPTRIEDPDDPRVEGYKALRGRDGLVRERGFIAEGLVVIEKALASGRHPISSILMSEARLERGVARLGALAMDVELMVASQDVLDRICGFPVHRGVLAFGPPPSVPSADALLEGLPRACVVVVIVGVNDPENIGAIFRNAAALGASAVLLDPQAGDPFYRRAIRVSVGAVLTLPSARLEVGQDLVATLQAAGFDLIALTPSGATPLKALARSERIALLLGAEGPGLPAALMSRVSTVRIPMADDFDSLNVAAASAVALHYLLG